MIGRGINAAHPGDENEITGTGTEIPGPAGLMASSGDNVLTPFGNTCAPSH